MPGRRVAVAGAVAVGCRWRELVGQPAGRRRALAWRMGFPSLLSIRAGGSAGRARPPIARAGAGHGCHGTLAAARPQPLLLSHAPSRRASAVRVGATHPAGLFRPRGPEPFKSFPVAPIRFRVLPGATPALTQLCSSAQSVPRQGQPLPRTGQPVSGSAGFREAGPREWAGQSESESRRSRPVCGVRVGLRSRAAAAAGRAVAGRAVDAVPAAPGSGCLRVTVAISAAGTRTTAGQSAARRSGGLQAGLGE